MNERKSPCVLQDFVPFGAAAQKGRKGVKNKEKGKKIKENEGEKRQKMKKKKKTKIKYKERTKKENMKGQK